MTKSNKGETVESKPFTAVTSKNGHVKKRKTIGLVRLQNRAGYLFVLPIIIGLVFFFIPVFGKTVFFSFNEVKMVKDGYVTNPIGFLNYISLFSQDSWYIQTALQSILSVFIDFISILFFSFFVAVLLNQKFKGRTIARVIFFLPVVLATGIVSKIESGDLLMSMMQQGAQASVGGINVLSMTDIKQFLLSTAFNPTLINFVVSAIDRMYSIIVSSGVQILIFIAGLQSIPSQLYEAAQVEGCSGWEAFWKITLPMISPLILVNGIYTIIDSCTKSTNTIMDQVLNQTMMANYSYASVMAIVYLGAIAIMMSIIFLVTKKLVFYQN